MNLVDFKMCNSDINEEWEKSVSLYEACEYDKAIALWHRLAEKDHIASMSMIGHMYDDGTGVVKDLSEAFFWYKKAAEKGFSGAQYSLGSMYYKGDFVEQDYEKAAYWYRLAANQNLPHAQYSLGYMYVAGELFEQHHVNAAIWFNLAAIQGHEEAKKAVELVMNNLTTGERITVYAGCKNWLSEYKNSIQS